MANKVSFYKKAVTIYLKIFIIAMSVIDLYAGILPLDSSQQESTERLRQSCTYDSTQDYLYKIDTTVEVIKQSIQTGANLNVKNLHGHSCLHETIRFYFQLPTEDLKILKCIEMLLTHGADLHLKDGSGQSPFQIAVRNFCLDYSTDEKFNQLIYLMKLLKIDLNTKDDRGYNAFHYVLEIYYSDSLANTGRIFTVLKNLFNAGMDINTKDLLGFTPLHDAIRYYCRNQDFTIELKIISLINLLLECGADLNTKDSNGHTAFHNIVLFYCRSQNHHIEDKVLKLIEYLKELGLDVLLKNDNQRTPRQEAVWWYFNVMNQKKARKILELITSLRKMEESSKNDYLANFHCWFDDGSSEVVLNLLENHTKGDIVCCIQARRRNIQNSKENFTDVLNVLRKEHSNSSSLLKELNSFLKKGSIYLDGFLEDIGLIENNAQVCNQDIKIIRERIESLLFTLSASKK